MLYFYWFILLLYVILGLLHKTRMCIAIKSNYLTITEDDLLYIGAIIEYHML